MYPTGGGECEFVMEFTVSRNVLPIILEIDPMPSCGYCTLRSKCAHTKLYWERVDARGFIDAALERKGFHHVYGGETTDWFVNRTANVLIYYMDNTVGIKLPRYCIEATYNDAAAVIARTNF